MKDVERRDRLGHALDRLNLMLCLFTSNANISEASNGLAFTVADAITDVEDVLRDMEDEAARPTA